MPKNGAVPVKFPAEHGKTKLENVDSPLWRGRLFIFSDKGPGLVGCVLGSLGGRLQLIFLFSPRRHGGHGV